MPKFEILDDVPPAPTSGYEVLPESPSMMSKAAGLGKAAASGIGSFYAQSAGMPGDIAEMGARGINHAAQFVGRVAGIDVPNREPQPARGGAADMQKFIEKYTGEFYKPQTTAEGYTNTIANFITGAVFGGGNMAANALKYGVLPGAASEAAGNATKGTSLEPIARGVAALGTGGVAALLSRPGTASKALSQQMAGSVDDVAMTNATRLMEDAAQRGIPLTWPEALEQVAPGTGLVNTQRLLESGRDTRGQMGQFMAGRSAAVDRAARDQFDQIAPINRDPSMIGPQVGEAAQNTVQDVTNAINRQTRPLYDAARQQGVGVPVHQALMGDPLYAQTLNEVRNNPALNRTIANLPDDNVAVIDLVQRRLREQGDNAAIPGQASTSNLAAANYGDARTAPIAAAETATGSRPGVMGDYEAARAQQAALRERFLNPLMAGPIGKLAQKDLTTQRAIEALFPAEVLPNSQGEVATAVSAVAQRNPQAARDLVRAHAEQTFNSATENLVAGENQFGGAKFAKALTGNPQQRANLEAAVRALPNGDQVWTGFDRFIDVVEATGKRQPIGSRTAFNAQDLKDLSGGRVTTEGMKLAAAPAKVLTKLGDTWDRWQMGRNMNELAGILTDPRSGPLLREIAKLPVGARSAQLLAGRLLNAGYSSYRNGVSTDNTMNDGRNE